MLSPATGSGTAASADDADPRVPELEAERAAQEAARRLHRQRDDQGQRKLVERDNASQTAARCSDQTLQPRHSADYSSTRRVFVCSRVSTD